jgi:hypothetical protein
MSTFICRFFILRASRTLILIIGVLPSRSAVLHYVLSAQLFLQPQRLPDREHNRRGNHVVAYSPQGCDSLSVLCCIFIGRQVLNQLHFAISWKYLPLFVELPYRSNNTGCCCLMQITHGVMVQKKVLKNHTDVRETLKTTVSDRHLLHSALIHMLVCIIVMN